jgi:hypothetical protein
VLHPMSFRFVTILAILFLFLTACVTASVTKLDSTNREPIKQDRVTIYLEEDDIEGDFSKVAVIDLSGSSGLTDESMIYEKAREEAAEIGANGVLFDDMEEAGTGERVASAVFGTGSDTDAKMITIYVEGKSSKVPIDTSNTSQ